MISYGKQTIDKEDLLAVTNSLQGDWLTQGPQIEIFEDNLKGYFGAKNCSVVSNGTAALHLSGLALGWKSGDIILTSPLSFVATANCVLYAGASVDFVDINMSTYQIDIESLESKLRTLKSHGKKVKALIAVDYAGNPCEWIKLRELADNYEFQLVNDNCHAMGAQYHHEKKYAVKYADIVTHSYHPVKNITTGEGGSVLTNSDSLHQKICDLRSHGITKDVSRLSHSEEPWYYEMQELGFNYRITDMQCALGSSQLKKLDSFIKKRNDIASYYDNCLLDSDLIQKPQIAKKSVCAYHLYPLLIDFKNLGIQKHDFFKNFYNKGINFQVHYIPIHLQPFYKKKFNYKSGDFPNSEEFYSKQISLPIYPSLKDSELQYVVKELNKFLSE